MVVPVIVSFPSTADPLFDINEVIDPINDRAAKADAFSETILTMVSNAIEDFRNDGLNTFDQTLYESITDTLFAIDDAGLSGLELTDPTSPDITSPVITAPTTVIPSAPEMDASDIDSVIGDVPMFNAEKLPINIPDLPSDPFPTFNTDAPTLSTVNLPNKPSYVLPALPTINDVTIPSPPEYNIASFEGTMPVTDLTAPETMFVYNEAEYNSDLKERLATELYAQLVAGGTGLDEDAEQAIWDRATARQETENEKAYTEALEFHSSRGFNLPEGVLNATLIEANDRINQRKDDLNNDILVQQSNLAQVNTHFIITQAIGMEKNLMDNANMVQNRAFEAAKAVVQMANEVYRIKVEAFIAQLEGYKVQASVYETKIRAEIAKAEFYKAQIEGIKAGIEAKSLLISAYNAQIEGIKSLIQMYATEMEAARIQSDIDRLKIEAYKTKAQVFGIQTDAITSQYNAYQSQIAGEAEKVKMYLADTQAYTARVEGFKAGASVEQIKAEVKLAKHKGDIEVFRAIVEQYKIESDRLVSKAETETKIEGLKIDKYKADVGEFQAKIDAIVKNYLAKVDKAKAEADILIKEREVAITKLLGEKGLTSDMILGQTKIGSQLVAAALTSISASASLGMSRSQGDSRSIGYSKGYNASVSENHSFPHSTT